MEKTINKLGLTDSERAINYTDNGAVRIAEIRHYDPVMGLLKIVDPMNNITHEMIYSSTSKNWFVPGTSITCDYNAEEPVVKQTDAWSVPIPTTVKRFPSNPLD